MVTTLANLCVDRNVDRPLAVPPPRHHGAQANLTLLATQLLLKVHCRGAGSSDRVRLRKGMHTVMREC